MNETEWCNLIWENRQYIKQIEQVNFAMDNISGMLIGIVIMLIINVVVWIIIIKRLKKGRF